MYSDGRGTDKNICEARKWFLLAAQNGNTSAQYELARISRFAVEPLRNYEEALQWYLSAATQGHEVAQYELGQMYIQGIGVERDEVQAHRWFCNQQNRDIYMRNIILPGCIAEVRVFHRTRKKRCTGLPKQQKMGQMGQGMPCMNWGNII